MSTVSAPTAPVYSNGRPIYIQLTGDPSTIGTARIGERLSEFLSDPNISLDQENGSPRLIKESDGKILYSNQGLLETRGSLDGFAITGITYGFQNDILSLIAINMDQSLTDKECINSYVSIARDIASHYKNFDEAPSPVTDDFKNELHLKTNTHMVAKTKLKGINIVLSLSYLEFLDGRPACNFVFGVNNI